MKNCFKNASMPTNTKHTNFNHKITEMKSTPIIQSYQTYKADTKLLHSSETFEKWDIFYHYNPIPVYLFAYPGVMPQMTCSYNAVSIAMCPGWNTYRVLIFISFRMVVHVEFAMDEIVEKLCNLIEFPHCNERWLSKVFYPNFIGIHLSVNRCWRIMNWSGVYQAIALRQPWRKGLFKRAPWMRKRCREFIVFPSISLISNRVHHYFMSVLVVSRCMLLKHAPVGQFFIPSHHDVDGIWNVFFI